MRQPALATTLLTKSYGDARGVIELGLEVPEGEVYGFLGPNGAGKTTTIRTLLDLLRPSSGEARVFGLDCERESVLVRRLVGYLSGELTHFARAGEDGAMQPYGRVVSDSGKRA